MNLTLAAAYNKVKTHVAHSGEKRQCLVNTGNLNRTLLYYNMILRFTTSGNYSKRTRKKFVVERRARNLTFVRQQIKLPSGVVLTLCKPKLDDNQEAQA